MILASCCIQIRQIPSRVRSNTLKAINLPTVMRCKSGYFFLSSPSLPSPPLTSSPFPAPVFSHLCVSLLSLFLTLRTHKRTRTTHTYNTTLLPVSFFSFFSFFCPVFLYYFFPKQYVIELKTKRNLMIFFGRIMLYMHFSVSGWEKRGKV